MNRFTVVGKDFTVKDLGDSGLMRVAIQVKSKTGTILHDTVLQEEFDSQDMWLSRICGLTKQEALESIADGAIERHLENEKNKELYNRLALADSMSHNLPAAAPTTTPRKRL